MTRLTASDSLRLLAEAGRTVSRNRKSAPGYQWGFDYNIDGAAVTIGRLRSEAERLPLEYNDVTDRYEIRKAS